MNRRTKLRNIQNGLKRKKNCYSDDDNSSDGNIHMIKRKDSGSITRKSRNSNKNINMKKSKLVYTYTYTYVILR